MLKRVKLFFSDTNSAYALLEGNDRRRIKLLVITQLFLSSLDLVGIFSIGIVTSLAISMDSNSIDNPLQDLILGIFRLQNLDRESQIIFFGLLAVTVLLTRTILSVKLTQYTFAFLARKAGDVSKKAINKFTRSSLSFVQQDTAQKTAYNLTIGIDRVTVGILGVSIGLLTDSGLVLILFLGLAVQDAFLALGIAVYFLIIVLWISRQSARKASTASKKLTELSIKTSEMIIDFITNYRELYTKSARLNHSNSITELRKKSVEFTAYLSFIPYLGKYIIESALVIGAVGLMVLQVSLHDFNQAANTLAIFLAASTRISPSIIRIQQSLIQLKGHASAAIGTLSMLNELAPIIETSQNAPLVSELKFTPNVVLKKVNFGYSKSNTFRLRDLNLEIPSGSSVAIIGASGSGKSTLVDLILGLHSPTSGSILIAGMKPKKAINQFPGFIGYVSQTSSIVKGTIKDNIIYPFQNNAMIYGDLEKILSVTQLSNFVKSLQYGLDTDIKELGKNLSGGQKQRLLLARSLYLQPSLLILDEATSAIDLITEDKILKALRKDLQNSTIIMITHRVATAKNADMVIFMQDGKIQTQGSYKKVSQFIYKSKKIETNTNRKAPL